jgi:hypothetical protein
MTEAPVDPSPTDTRPASRAGYKMRRDHDGHLRRVVVFGGVEGYVVRWTAECSGCTEHGEMGGATYGPFGCDECGYSGKRRREFWSPFDLNQWDEAHAGIHAS